MKIEATKTEHVKTLSELIPGTAFWWGGLLYMKLKKLSPPDFAYNVVSLDSGQLFKWNLDKPGLANVKIVGD